MQDADYRENIIESIQLLEGMENRLFTAMVNIGMYGVHRDIHKSFGVGDIFNFELSMFEDSGDANLDHLARLIREVSACRMHLVNINAIKEEELTSPDDLDV